ncbi:MAG: hypothetical protein GYB31_01740 [Bacteroidetes bacterium]|nr:hypothetical protein [Bacteroidota bacterium]
MKPQARLISLLCGIIFVFLFNNLVYSQTAAEEVLRIGEIKSGQAQERTLIVEQPDPNSGDLRLKFFTGETYERTEHAGILSEKDVKNLLSLFESFQSHMINTSPESYTEQIFTSEDGLLESGCFFSREFNDWMIYFELNKNQPDSFIFLSAEKVKEVVDLLRIEDRG